MEKSPKIVPALLIGTWEYKMFCPPQLQRTVHMAKICKLAIPLTYLMYAFELYNMCTHGDSRTIFLFYNVKILSSFSGDKISIIMEILHDAW